jgi:hypothetical protein
MLPGPRATRAAGRLRRLCAIAVSFLAGAAIDCHNCRALPSHDVLDCRAKLRVVRKRDALAMDKGKCFVVVPNAEFGLVDLPPSDDLD